MYLKLYFRNFSFNKVQPLSGLTDKNAVKIKQSFQSDFLVNGMDENAQRHIIAKFNRKKQREYFKKYQRSQELKRIEEKKRKPKKPKNHAVEIELTKRQSEGLLYVAFKPTKKELCLKRFFFNIILGYFRENNYS